MLISRTNMDDLFKGFDTAFNKGFTGAQTYYRELAMVVPSSAREENYAWLGQFPNLREWIGDRVIKSLSGHRYALLNKDFESTISVKRNDIEDDRYGVFGPMFEELGRVSAEHPDTLLFALLNAGFGTVCYDGQYFFDTDHPVGTDGGDYPVQSVSNFGGGSGTPWFLLDLSRAIRPVIWQERRAYKLTRLDRDEDQNVFMRNEYIYGLHARANAGFGLWQLAYGSKATLDLASFVAARVAMRSQKGDNGRPLGIRPTHLVVPPALEAAARTLLESDSRTVVVGDGVTSIGNEWKGSTKLIVTEWLA